MKKGLIITLVALLAVAGVAVVSCPDKEDHKEAVMAVVNEKINDELAVSSEEDMDIAGLLGGIASLGSHVGGWLLDNNLTVKNHFVYSVGYLNTGDGPQQISVGVFGHVFTFSKEDLDQALADLM